MKSVWKNKEDDAAAQEQKKTGVDLKECTDEEFWHEVKYSGSDNQSER